MKKRLLLCTVIALVLFHTTAYALVEQNILLDTAFSMLEAGNPILERYNKITGADVQVGYELGLPYFYGGRKESLLMTIAEAQETTYSFTQGERYIYGFDCSGYTNWINSKTGRPQHDTLEYMITKYWKYRDNQLPVKDIAYDQLKDYLQVGDYLVANHNGRHIMMYIGTLADYGYTAEDVPASRGVPGLSDFNPLREQPHVHGALYSIYRGEQPELPYDHRRRRYLHRRYAPARCFACLSGRRILYRML